jgi:hypothetical protein
LPPENLFLGFEMNGQNFAQNIFRLSWPGTARSQKLNLWDILRHSQDSKSQRHVEGKQTRCGTLLIRRKN